MTEEIRAAFDRWWTAAHRDPQWLAQFTYAGRIRAAFAAGWKAARDG